MILNSIKAIKSDSFKVILNSIKAIKSDSSVHAQLIIRICGERGSNEMQFEGCSNLEYLQELMTLLMPPKVERKYPLNNFPELCIQV